CFFGEKKRTRTGSWPLLSYAPWVLQLLSEFAPRLIIKYYISAYKLDNNNPCVLTWNKRKGPQMRP
ncbi:hypothetical protein, partial [Klebsiella michiganensis]|uniref:hypothetical protein n=1 Tax=Klebsiella michiganensis TaxID=1134687 RepID=UPI001CB8031E